MKGYVGQTTNACNDAKCVANRQAGNFELRSANIDAIYVVADTASVVEDQANPSIYAPLMNEPGADILHVS